LQAILGASPESADNFILVSIYESGSTDDTPKFLAVLEVLLVALGKSTLHATCIRFPTAKHARLVWPGIQPATSEVDMGRATQRLYPAAGAYPAKRAE
jgi:hypothetical protein